MIEKTDYHLLEIIFLKKYSHLRVYYSAVIEDNVKSAVGEKSVNGFAATFFNHRFEKALLTPSTSVLRFSQLDTLFSKRS